MDKVIKIGDKEVGFRATALTPRLYRHMMGRDMLQDLELLRKSYIKAVTSSQNPTEDEKQKAQLSVPDLEIFENAAYVMAKQYDRSIPDNMEEWLDNFEMFSIYEILPQMLELWASNEKTTAKPKKK